MKTAEENTAQFNLFGAWSVSRRHYPCSISSGSSHFLGHIGSVWRCRLKCTLWCHYFSRSMMQHPDQESLLLVFKRSQNALFSANNLNLGTKHLPAKAERTVSVSLGTKDISQCVCRNLVPKFMTKDIWKCYLPLWLRTLCFYLPTVAWCRFGDNTLDLFQTWSFSIITH